MLTILFSIWLIGFVFVAFWPFADGSGFLANIIVGALWPIVALLFLWCFAPDWLWPKRMPHERETAESWAPELNSLRNENQDLRNRNADLQRQIESLNDDFVRLTKNYEAAARTVRRVREAACDVSGGIE